MFPAALSTLSDAHAVDFREERKSTPVVAPQCEWVCTGVDGVLLEAASEFSVGSNSQV